MREIKFRAFDRENGRMYSWQYMKSYPMYFIESDLIIPMQFTGLTDKNGKEIYEGDIVAYPKIALLGAVIYKDGRFIIDEVDDGEQDCNFWNDLEIIGNIYENPELLEVEQCQN